ncbi:MAG: hypothetical protein V4722_01475 [Bacteroidota bacterium]
MKKKQIFIVSLVGAAMASVAAYLIVKRKSKKINGVHSGDPLYAGNAVHTFPYFSQ